MSDQFTDVFKVHQLNPAGLQLAESIADAFSTLLAQLEHIIPEGRELSLTRTKLQEACFFAKRGIAMQPENQLGGGYDK